MNGYAKTVAAINGDSNAVIEGLLDNTGLNADSTLTVNNATDCTFAGVIRNSAQGSGTGKVNLVKNGPGDLVLTNTNLYTGSTTVSGGMLQVTGLLQSTSGVSVASGAALYFNNSSGCPARADHRDGGRADLSRGHGFSAGRGTTRR